MTETRSEMKKVTFPSRDEVVSTSIVVVISSFIFGGFLYVADLIIQGLYQGLFRVLGA
ncbi:MAG: preprotein translocase subunit SecE [Acidobacteriota bacterium]